jgi:hypothetical protein
VQAVLGFEQSHISFFHWQFIGTFVLVFVVFSISDRHNSGLHRSLFPLAIFFVILGVGAAFGMQTGASRHHKPGSLSTSWHADVFRHVQAMQSTPHATSDRAL